MAMTTCRECGARMSTNADRCPQCGDNSNAGWSLRKRLVVCGLVFWAIAGMIGTSPSSRTSETATAAAPSAPAVDPEAEARFRHARAAFVGIRRAVRDPDSLKVESLETSIDGRVVCMRYRSRNGFGGMVRSAVVFDGDVGQPATDKMWAAKCRALFDMHHVAD